MLCGNYQRGQNHYKIKIKNNYWKRLICYCYKTTLHSTGTRMVITVTWILYFLNMICFTRAGVLYFGHFLGAPGEFQQLKPSEDPLQLKAFLIITRAVGSFYGPLLLVYRQSRAWGLWLSGFGVSLRIIFNVGPQLAWNMLLIQYYLKTARRAFPRNFYLFLFIFIIFSIVSSFLSSFLENRHLRPQKPALKQPNRDFKEKNWSKRSKPALKGPNRPLTEALGELCLK